MRTQDKGGSEVDTRTEGEAQHLGDGEGRIRRENGAQAGPSQQAEQPKSRAAQRGKGQPGHGTGTDDQCINQDHGGLQQMSADGPRQPGHFSQQSQKKDAEETDEDTVIGEP